MLHTSTRVSLYCTMCISLSVYLCVRVLILKSRSGFRYSLPLAGQMCTYSYDVNKVIFSQCIQDCVDGVFGYGQPESLHTATDIHHDHHIFRRSGCLDIPKRRQQIEVGCGKKYILSLLCQPD